MITKNLLVLCLVVVAITVVSGAPRAIKNEDDLKRSVVEFLSQDKEFLTALEHSGLVVEQSPLGKQISKRDAEEENNETTGFFKKAAKVILKIIVEKVIETIGGMLFG
ncbi:uncharacterized protein LOC114339811 isoform X2 [Diabrotica virgifera virgifera]|uniref:Uncharacterized protein LOC114339811 isoform X2 n=1 Tax=Diabrotica virgifera virgifera TaxID=50390 RepID=A0A6P7GK15_DIAVI|nr:uncharacterized protein LOC114339811 isoform X2 [Diabrotica virgifera virgifera]